MVVVGGLALAASLSSCATQAALQQQRQMLTQLALQQRNSTGSYGGSSQGTRLSFNIRTISLCVCRFVATAAGISWQCECAVCTRPCL